MSNDELEARGILAQILAAETPEDVARRLTEQERRILRAARQNDLLHAPEYANMMTLLLAVDATPAEPATQTDAPSIKHESEAD